jgi:hypothetical protein
MKEGMLKSDVNGRHRKKCFNLRWESDRGIFNKRKSDMFASRCDIDITLNLNFQFSSKQWEGISFEEERQKSNYLPEKEGGLKES